MYNVDSLCYKNNTKTIGSFVARYVRLHCQITREAVALFDLCPSLLARLFLTKARLHYFMHLISLIFSTPQVSSYIIFSRCLKRPLKEVITRSSDNDGRVRRSRPQGIFVRFFNTCATFCRDLHDEERAWTFWRKNVLFKEVIKVVFEAAKILLVTEKVCKKAKCRRYLM